MAWRRIGRLALGVAGAILGVVSPTLAAGPLEFHSVTPCRVVDTRSLTTGGPALTSGTNGPFAFAGKCGIPAEAQAVSVNVTAVMPTAAGFLALYPGPSVPLASTINYLAGQVRANSAIVSLSPAGDIRVACGQGSGTVNMILDVNGYYRSHAPPIGIRGIAYQSYQEGTYGDATQTPVLDFLASEKANWISFNTPFIFDKGTQRIAPRPGVTDFGGLPVAFDRASQRGLKRALYVFVQTESYGSLYGPETLPTNVVDFFGQFKTLVLQYADMAQANGVEMLILGNEMNALSGPAYQAFWTDIISTVRARYSGKLTYGAIPDYTRPPSLADVQSLISFWDQLDYIGFSVYPRLSNNLVPTRGELEDAWARNVYTGTNILQNLRAYSTVTGKPIVFVEVGYQSVDGAAINPGSSVGGTGTPNNNLQAVLYDVMFSQVNVEKGPWLAGMFLWSLDTWNEVNSLGYYVGGYRAVDFSFRGKPAGDVVQRWYDSTF